MNNPLLSFGSNHVDLGGISIPASDTANNSCMQITDSDMEKFAAGIHYTVYEKLGAHPMEIDGVSGVCFAVWAPNAVHKEILFYRE